MTNLMPSVLGYIDPGAGSLLIQVIIGTILAVPFFLRTQLARIYRLVRRQPAPADGETGNFSGS